MAVTPSAISRAILDAAPDLRGPSWVRVVPVIGASVASWLLSSVTLQGATVGSVGGGSVVGKLFVVPAPLLVPSSLGSTFFGILAPQVGRAVGIGVASAINASAAYQGVSAGVGSGVDASRVLQASGSALVSVLSATARASGLVGADVPRLCVGLGTGLAVLVATATGAGVVAGPGAPVPGTGTSFSRVV